MAERRYGNNLRRRNKGQQESFFDYTLLFIVLFLLAFGLVMLYSTSSYDGSQQGDPAFFLKRQLTSTIIGLAAMMVVANIPYHFWEHFAMLGYVASIILILLIIPFGYEANGAKRWIRVAGMSIQPAEVAKLGMILFLASLICRMGRNIRTGKGFMIVLMIPMPICVESYGKYEFRHHYFWHCGADAVCIESRL